MALVYNPFDVFSVQRNATSSSFVETILRATPNSIVYFNSGSAITTLSTQSFAEQVVSASLTNFTASLAINAISASHALVADTALNVPDTASYADFSVSSSHALTADTASYSPGSVSSSHANQADIASLLVQAGALNTHVPTWQNNQLTSGSAIYIVDGKYVSVNSASYLIDPANTPALYVKQLDPDNFNVALFEGTVNENFLQLTVDNKGVGAAGSADLVASSNVGNNFVDLGINNSDYNVPSFNITSGSDGYLYASQGSLAIGTSTAGKVTKFFAGGTTSDKEVARVTEGGLLMTGSLLGTASVAISASWAPFTDTGTTLFTGSTYEITASSAVSASWAPYVDTGTVLFTGSTYPITASVAVSASYALVEPNYSSSVAILIDAKQPTLVTGNTYTITSSWSEKSTAADSASFIIPGATLYVVSSSTNPSYIEPFNIPTVPYTPPYKEGRMFYDKDYSNWVYYTDQNFKLHIGKEVIWRVYNATGAPLATGTPVYLSGSTNGLDPDVYPGISDGTNTKSDVVGVMRYTTANGATGYICQAGVIHNLDMTGFSIGDEIFLSSTVLGGLTNVDPGQPYESVHLGYCQVGGLDGSLTIGPSLKIPPVIAYAGMTSIPTITSDGSGSIYVSTGSVNLYSTTTGLGGVLGYPLATQTMSLVTGSTNYVVAELSNSLATYTLVTSPSYADGISIVRVATLDIYNETTSSWDVHTFQVGIVGLALANRTNNKDIELYGYQRQDGLTLFVTGSSGSFGITEGTIWYGPNNHTLPTFDTTAGSPHLYIFHTTSSNGTSSWHQHTSSIFVSGLYDSGSYDLVAVPETSWSVNFVYRLVGDVEDEAAIVMSSDWFDTELEASNNATTPANLPSTIVDMGLLVGRFVVQSGSYNPTIESAFSNIFIPAVVTNHEALLGLQGSTIGTGGGHYHLTSQDYTGNGTGVVVRSDGASLTNATITGSITTASHAAHATSASYATTSSWAPNLYPQTEQVSASWASASISASYSPVEPNYSASVSTQFGTKQATLVTGQAYTITSSWSENATSASFAPVEPNYSASVSTQIGTKQATLVTGNTYTITSSWSENATSASYAPTNTDYSASVSSQIGTKQATLVTGQTYTITSSWSENAVSASFAPVEPNYSASVSVYFGTKQDTLVVAATYPITASSAVSASWAPYTDTGTTLYTASTYQITASSAISASWAPGGQAGSSVSSSWASASISASYAEQARSASWAPTSPASEAVSASWASSSFSASYAPTNTAYSASVSSQIGTKQDTLVTGNTYTITSSWANNVPASGVSGVLTSAQAPTAVSASYASSSTSASFAPVEQGYSASVSTQFGTKQDTLVTGQTYTITSSWAEMAQSSSFLTRNRTYEITASFANTASVAISSSYAPSNTSVFSRGGSFYDPYGIAGLAALSQSVHVWRAPFNCTATAIYGIMVGNSGVTASLTAWRNGNTMLTAPIQVTGSNIWIQNSTATLISASFVTGDRLQITFLTASTLGVTQSAVQIDFTRP